MICRRGDGVARQKSRRAFWTRDSGRDELCGVRGDVGGAPLASTCALYVREVRAGERGGGASAAARVVAKETSPS